MRAQQSSGKTSSTAKGGSPMSIEDSIRDTDARFAEAFNRGDLAAVVALHSADALILGPDSPAERGGQAVEDGYKPAFPK